jgi:phosphoglycerate dehydrogenase-like enzyme
MKIFITIPKGKTRDTFITDKAMAKLEELGEVTGNTTSEQLSVGQLCEAIKDVDVLISGWGTHKIDKSILDSAGKLKIIAHTGGTVADLVDEQVYQKGIKVLSGNNIYAKSVAEGCLCYTISALRRIEHYVNLVRTGGWHGDGFFNKGLFNKRVGLVGFGAIARYFAAMLHLFDTDIYVYSSHMTKEDENNFGVKKASLDDIFEKCDIVSLHSALTPQTKGMINKNLLSKIRPGALLVNTARGALIDEPELINQLKTGRFYAVLDVFANEPLPPDSPLRTLPNVLPVPHMAGPTVDMREQVVLSLADDIKNYIEGKSVENEIPYEHAVRMTRV